MTELPTELLELVERQMAEREAALAPLTAEMEARLAELYAQRAVIDDEITSLQARRSQLRAAVGLAAAPAVATKTTLRDAVLSVLSCSDWLTRDQVAALVNERYPGQWHASSVGVALTDLARERRVVARNGAKRSTKEYRVV